MLCQLLQSFFVCVLFVCFVVVVVVSLLTNMNFIGWFYLICDTSSFFQVFVLNDLAAILFR